MLAAIRRSLALKVSLTLTLVTIPLVLIAAYLITAKQVESMEELTISQGKVGALIGAKAWGEIMEHAIDAGYILATDAFDTNYEEIKGYDFGDKPKYHTKYDGFTDFAMVGLLDKFVENPIFAYAVGEDINGYVPSHNTVAMKPLVGNVATDRVGFRAKRIFNNDVELKAAQNVEPYLVQVYHRDTGATLIDVSCPIYVKGKHWGGFRVGLPVIELEARKMALIIQLALIFVILGGVTIGLIFFMMKRAMRPLESLSATANEISTGEGLDVPIVPGTTDEVGRMAKSIDRLRASLNAAMERLGE